MPIATVAERDEEKRSSHSGGSPKRLARLIVVVLILLVVAGAAVWWFAIRDSGDGGGGGASSPDGATESDGAPVTAPPASDAQLDDGGEELASLLAESRDETFHAVYEATQPPETEGGQATSYTVELFRSEGRTRQDTITELEGGTYRTAGILADGKSVVCSKQGAADWVCSEAEQEEESAADGIFGSLVRSLGGAEVTARDDKIDGRDVRCFEYTTADGPGSMCLTDDGIPVAVTAGTVELRLVDLDDEVDDDAFTSPAEPVRSESSGRP